MFWPPGSKFGLLRPLKSCFSLPVGQIFKQLINEYKLFHLKDRGHLKMTSKVGNVKVGSTTQSVDIYEIDVDCVFT